MSGCLGPLLQAFRKVGLDVSVMIAMQSVRSPGP
jgi:hypothetical protein